ncbi:acireductone synthase [Micromonospora echinospora]
MDGTAAAVLDIEGTTGSIAHVRDVLFPYARRRMGHWLSANRGTPAWHEVMSGVRTGAEAPGLDERKVLATLTQWSDHDVKAPALKYLQGLIWADGYADGTLRGHVYDDVPVVLARWRSRSIGIYIYSSGSAQAQRAWFAHSSHGDLSPFITGYFDLGNAGPKAAVPSYEAISAAVPSPAGRTWFFSDVAGELDAARSAGWNTIAVRRPGDERGGDVVGHHTVDRLDAALIP